MDTPACRVTLDVTAKSEAVMEQHFALFLRTRGWHVAEPGQAWERLGAFITRVELSGHDAFHRRLSEWSDRGHVIPITRSPCGHIKEILANAAFDDFCRK